MMQDFLLAARTLRKHPAITALAITALALGIGANCAIFSVVNAILLAPLPYADPHHLYEIGSVDDKGRTNGASVADFAALEDHGAAFARVSSDRFWSFNLTDATKSAERVYGRGLSRGTFALLGVEPLLGRGFLEEDFRAGAPRVAVLSYRFWKRRYSADSPIAGLQVHLDGESYAVIGVMPASFQFPINVYDIYVPWLPSAAELSNRNDHGSIIYARLKPGVTLAQAQASLDSFARAIAEQFPGSEKIWHPQIGPTKLGSSDQFRTQLLVLLGAVGLVLLIACLNVANLLLARNESRKREMRVRIALGAGTWRILRQLLAESLLLAFSGAAAGLLLAGWGAWLLMASFPVRAPRPKFEYTGMDGWVIGFALAVTVLAAIVFGLAPALELARVELNDSLKRRGPRAGFRATLIVSETALSLILLAGAGLMIRSFERLLEVQPGFQADNVLTVQVPMPSFLAVNESRRDVEVKHVAEYRDLVDRMGALPGVSAAAFTTLLPLGPVDVGTKIGFEADPKPNQDHSAILRCVSADYFRAMGIPVMQGRTFTDRDIAGAPSVGIVNDVVARKYWPDESPIGKHVNMSGLARGPWIEVVGMVGGIRHHNLKTPPDPELYIPYQQYLGPAFAAALLVRGSSNAETLAPTIRREIRTSYPDQPVGDVKLMTDIVAESVALPRFYTSLLTAFSLLALTLAAAGIYGVMAYSVAQRTREVGIRMALGATRRRVVTLVLKESLSMVAFGVVLGIGGAMALARLIESQLYSTAPNDPLTLASVSMLLLLVASLASYMPASKAAGTDPNVALRDE